MPLCHRASTPCDYGLIYRFLRFHSSPIFPGMNMGIVLRSSPWNEKTILIIALFWNFKKYSEHSIFQWYISKQLKHYFFVNCDPQVCLYTHTHICIHKHFFFKERRAWISISTRNRRDSLSGVFHEGGKTPKKVCPCFLLSGVSPSLSLSKTWSSFRAHLIKILVSVRREIRCVI